MISCKVDVDIDHDESDWPIASQESATLTLWEEPGGGTRGGLWAKIGVEPAIAARVERGEFRGCSFTFVPGTFDRYGLEGIRPLNELREVDLRSVTLVTKRAIPTYDGTAVYTEAQFKALRSGHGSR